MTEKAMKTNNSNPLFHAIFTHPLPIVAATLWLFLIMPTGFLFLFPLGLGNDPERGFETDGTPFSGQRLAWTLLQPALVQGSLANFAPADSARRRDKRSWADDLVLSFGSVACYDEPIPAMSFLSQFLVTIPGREELFSRDFLLQMCQLQQELALELSTFAPFTPYRTVWSLPNYVGCLGPNSRANCSFMTDEDIHAFRSAFDHCLLHRHNILACRRSCQPSSNFESAESQQPCPDKVNNKACEKVPNKCDGQMWFDLFYRILPADLSLRPLPLNSFLPFYSFSAYRLQGINIGLKAFSDFEAKIVALADESQVFELKGLSLDTKRDLLLEAAVRDSRFSLLAALAIFLLLLLYSLSLAFALAVLLQLFAAVLSSLAIFRLFLTELPLLNTVAFVLLISVGSDGAFLLLDIFPAAEKLTQTSLNRALAHTCKTMFLTQFSTVVPFLLNLLSNVFAFRSFGLFAGLTLVFNYLLLISFLPAFLVAQKRYLNPCLVRLWPSRCWYCFSGSSSALSLDSLPNATPLGAHIAANLPARVPSTRLDRSRHFIRTLLDEVLPAVLIQGRFVWLGSLLVFLAVSAYLTLTQLSLPRYNPLQLFRSQNPHEYFEQNAEQLFPFVADKIAGLPFTIRLVWGIRPGRVLSHFDPKSAETPLRPDPHFVLNSTAQLQALAHQLEQIRTLPFVSHPSKFWPEKFIDWIASLPCSSAPQSPCCRIEESSNELDRCIRLSTTFIPTGYNDTLVWNNQTHQLVGYTALLPTRLPYSHRFHNLSASFALLDKFLPSDKTMPAGWYTTEWTVISQWFDLQLGIISDCKQSFIVSFAVVFIFSAMMLRMKAIYATITIFCIVLCTIGTLVFFGWEIGVLEGVILVLVVGLSFDYTLHIGALIPRHGCPEHQIQRAIRGAIRPVGMSGLSSILAGSVMLQAETHAFYQVSVFLVVCSSLSLIFAIFFFPPILYVITTASQSLHCQSIARTECEWCQQKNFKMKRLKKKSEGTI